MRDNTPQLIKPTLITPLVLQKLGADLPKQLLLHAQKLLILHRIIVRRCFDPGIHHLLILSFTLRRFIIHQLLLICGTLSFELVLAPVFFLFVRQLLTLPRT